LVRRLLRQRRSPRCGSRHAILHPPVQNILGELVLQRLDSDLELEVIGLPSPTVINPNFRISFVESGERCEFLDGGTRHQSTLRHVLGKANRLPQTTCPSRKYSRVAMMQPKYERLRPPRHADHHP
jgi:hypothetical protein